MKTSVLLHIRIPKTLPFAYQETRASITHISPDYPASFLTKPEISDRKKSVMALSRPRLIDTIPDRKDGLEMKILVLGMPRTGSICKL